MSTRGVGTLDGEQVKDDYKLITVDIVADPSAPDAFVQGIMEGKEWIWDNGIIKEVNIERYKQEIQKATMRQLDEAKLRAFEDFLSKL